MPDKSNRDTPSTYVFDFEGRVSDRADLFKDEELCGKCFKRGDNQRSSSLNTNPPQNVPHA